MLIIQGMEALSSAQGLSQKTFNAELISLQNRLHAVENMKDPLTMLFGSVKKDEFSTFIPFGQAICSSLLARGMKIVIRSHQCRLSFGAQSYLWYFSRSKGNTFTIGWFSLYSQHSLIVEIKWILTCSALRSGNAFDPLVLKMIVVRLNEMDSSRNADGRLVDQDGALLVILSI